MPIFGLTEQVSFPPADLADENGILAVGGDFDPKRLLLAYSMGIFPWPHEDMPLLWFSPENRFVLTPKDIHLSRSLRKAMRKEPYRITFDTCFSEIMMGCQANKRPDQNGTWITDEMIAGYSELHHLGFAHSIEAFMGERLVGGLYGVSIGGTFFGESMFALEPEASKIAFATLGAHLIEWDFDLIDCQTETHHLGRFGAHLIPRSDFLRELENAHQKPTKRGPWVATLTSTQALGIIAAI